MASVVSREYCLAHPVEISQLYGLNVFFGTLLNKRRTVLERVSATFAENRLAMPGPLGESYRLSALFELRAARIYRAMAERFAAVVPAHELFKELQEEEEEHARLMNICLYTVRLTPDTQYVPSVRDPEIRSVMKQMRAVERRVPAMTLEEALRVSVELELGEVNMVFGKLLKQVAEPEIGLLRQMMRHAESHQESVPRRIGILRQQLEKLGIKG
jgi:rubrerythrin